MEPPDHVALQYLRAGFSMIPLDPHSKQPSADWLPNRQWQAYQTAPASADTIRMWADRDDLNWGAICGQVSHGAYCGDVDNLDFATWVLADPKRPIFQGACIVRTGSHKAHIWFRSPNPLRSGAWKIGTGKIGDIRGDGANGRGGSYMVVPPSIHPSGERYVRVAGYFNTLPVITDGKAFLDAIARAWRADAPAQAPTDLRDADMAILDLDDAQVQAVHSRVKALRLKKKILDTLFVPGNQDPYSPHWERSLGEMTYSEIDFAVVAELVRKGLSLDEIEEVFACTLVGAGCYAKKDRSHHGHSYLLTTYKKVQVKVEEQAQQGRVATGNNFRVLEVTCTDFGTRQSTYHVRMVYVKDNHEEMEVAVDLTNAELATERQTRQAVFDQAKCMLDFQPGHKGVNFWRFGQALASMRTDTVRADEAHTRFGLVAGWLQERLKGLPGQMPAKQEEAHRLGWSFGGTYYLRSTQLSLDVLFVHRHMKPEEVPQVLKQLGDVQASTYLWPGGQAEPIIKLTPTNARPSAPSVIDV